MRSIVLAALLVLGGCTAVVDQGSLFPEMAMTGQPPALVVPPGYTLDERMLDVPGLRQVHAVRMTRPGSVGTLLYSAATGRSCGRRGNGSRGWRRSRGPISLRMIIRGGAGRRCRRRSMR